MKLLAPILILASFLANAIGLRAETVGLIDIKGPIGPATATYISRAIEVSAARKDVCIIVRLDTPGGLLDSTRDIVESFYTDKIPVVVYVAPAPASATSAGVFITMAAHIAVMAPHTSIGAAHPVSIGMTGEAEKTDDVMKQKAENYAASFAQAIAEKRNRNAEWARKAVVESASITAEEALDLNVVDLIAVDVPDLLKKINGREIDGRILATEGAEVIEVRKTPRERFLHIFLRPTWMFVLMLIVIYGIMGELSNPGAILPGVAGAIALILVLYMSAVLPVNIAGLALIGLAIVLFILEAFVTSHGLLSGGAIVSFFLGALMLFDRSEPAFRLSLSVILPATILTALFFLLIVAAGLRAQRLPVRAGRETMIGQTIAAMSRIDAGGGKVFIEGEIWNAVSDVPVEPNQRVTVIGIEGLTLKVKPASAGD